MLLLTHKLSIFLHGLRWSEPRRTQRSIFTWPQFEREAYDRLRLAVVNLLSSRCGIICKLYDFPKWSKNQQTSSFITYNSTRSIYLSHFDKFEYCICINTTSGRRNVIYSIYLTQMDIEMTQPFRSLSVEKINIANRHVCRWMLNVVYHQCIDGMQLHDSWCPASFDHSIQWLCGSEPPVLRFAVACYPMHYLCPSFVKNY